MRTLEQLFKWIVVFSLVLLIISYFLKDRLPVSAYYDMSLLDAPSQRLTREREWTTSVNGQDYIITPKYDYELYGVVVSYNDSDELTDIWHHDKWKDFINLRDLCVIWGDNVASDVYRRMDFDNDSWTCWAYWPDRATAEEFSMTELSNNHLLTDNPEIKELLMAAEPGDHIRLKGMLAEYRNPANGFYRKTSTVRTDTGNGACETIYLTDFEIISKANPGWRGIFYFATWTLIIALPIYILLLGVAPVRSHR